MMRFTAVCAAFIAAMFVISSAYAEEKSIEEYAKVGPGVYNVKTNDDGEITSLIVVGQARISTVLGVSKGKEIARKKASLKCDAEFIKWCKNSLTVKENSNDEQIVVLQGEEKDDSETLNEEGKGTEAYSEVIESYASGTLRGMQVLYSNVNAESKEYTIVKGLNFKKLDTIKKAVKKINSDETDEEVNTNETENEEVTTPKNHKGTLKNESFASPNASEFL